MCGGSLYWTMAVIIAPSPRRRGPSGPGPGSRSSSHLAALKDMDGLGQLTGAPGAAAELTQNPVPCQNSFMAAGQQTFADRLLCGIR